MGTITRETADFVTKGSDPQVTVSKDAIMESKRKIAFVSGHHLNLRDVIEVDVSGTWWRIKTSDGKFHLVDPTKVNYASIV